MIDSPDLIGSRANDEFFGVANAGGEEFLVVLPTTNLSGARIALEKLRAAVEEEKFEYGGKEIPVTVSCGLAQVQMHINESYEQTIARADEALYFSKHEGRNRVSDHDGKEIKVVKLA